MPEELYSTPTNNSGVASGWLAVNGVGQQDQALQGMNDDTRAYIETLAPEERQKAIDDFNAPLTGMEVYEALKQSQDFKPTHEEYTRYLAYDKEHKTSVLEGLGMLGEGMSAVMGDLGKAAGAVIDHPMSGLAKAPASLIEAFAQGTRNLYGMVAQSASPDSVLFKMKNALAGDGTVDGYNQFLEARKFNKHSAALAEGKETLVMDKDVIDKDLTLAMSYIADPTLFIPFGAAASAGMKAVGMGEKIALMGSRAASIKAAIIGGGLKWGVGAPIEALASVTRGTIERGAALGGAVLETTTGISAAELKATAKLSAAGTTTASALGGHIPIISDISNTYVAAGAARGFGEAIGAVGEQIQKQGFKRGYNSFAREALEQTKGLSPHAKGLLKVLDAVDPMFSYGYGTAVGAGHGALIGGTLGYLNAGEEGMYHGMGAGIALGATGAVGGRMFADVAGGTKMARAEIQGGFVIENMRADKHINLEATELYLELATRNGDRAGALQVIGGLDRVAPDMRLILGNVESQKKLLQSKGLNEHGHKVDPKTGKVEMRNGKPIEYEAPLAGFYGGEGFVMHTERDGNGKQQVTVVINTDALIAGKKNVMHHELFHAVFKTTIMEKMFRDNFAEAILGKFDANGIKVKDSEINPKEFKAFVTRELANTVDPATNKKLAPAELTRRLKEFDYHLAEYQKAGTTAKMNPDSAKALNYLVEEFGAHYATQFMKGKPVDYLFRGAEYTGMQGVMDRLHNGFLDFWQGQTGRQNPTFGDFKAKGFDESFAPNKGKRTLDQRSPALDYMVQDLLRSVAGKRKGSTNSFDVRTMSPEARNAYFNSSGMDGVRAYYDKDGKLRNVTEAQVTAERLEVGKAIHESLSKLDPKETAGLADADGNFGSSSTLGTKFNDTVLAHLVKEGHISQQLAERIKTVQDIVSGQGSNRVSYLYKGASHETEVGPNSPRLYGKDVPITARETIVVGYKITIKKDGTMSLVMKGLDAKVMDERGNIQWAKPEVRALWQGDRNAFDQSFMEYLSNASKASTDRTRVESSLLPSLAMGDGLGAERRNVMHQFLGMAKRKDAGYFNTPIAEIPRGKTSVVTNFTMDTMSPMRSDSPIRYDFNLDNAHSDLSRNFKVSDMDYEKTPQGDVFTHASKYKIVSVKDQQAHLYDANGKSLGAFKDKDLAGIAMEKAYAAERAETEVRIERIKEDQQKQQQNFKVWDEGTMAEGRRLGDIFETEQGKAFVHGTTLIRQTREEFYSDNFSKLRQADPDTVMAVTEQIAQRGYALRDLRTKAYDRLQAELAKGKGREYKKARDEYDTIVSHADRYNDILLAYERATRAKTNGQGILDYINTHRRTSTGYDNMAKVFFGDHYDSQFQTGKPVTTVATHGTSSHELLTSREFDPKQSGSKHGAEHDKVGIFLSGETKTSHGYADPKEKDFGYRQVRAAIKFNNPLVVDAQFKCYSPEVYEGYMKKVRDGGHDGVIIKNVYDGGSADTVFIVNNDSVKANTAIIDTHIGMERVKRQSENISDISADSDQGSVRYPIQESMPRGKDVRVGSQLGLSWKVDDTTPESQRGTPSVLVKNIGAELLQKGIASKKIELSDSYKGLEIGGLKGIAHTADTMAVGELKISNKTVENLQGGMFFHMLHGDLADFWASTFAGEGESSVLVKWMNEAIKVNGRKFNKPESFITLVKPDNDKIFQSPTGTKSVLQILDHLVENGAMSPETLKQHLIDASMDKYVSGKKKGSDKQKISFDETESYRSLMEQALEELPTHSFENRKLFIESLFSKIAKSKEVSGNAYLKMREVIGGKSWNAKNTSKFTAAEANRVFGDLLAEPMIRDVPKGHAYAVIKIKSPIAERVDSGLHESYRSTVVQTSGKKPVMSIMTRTAPAWDIVNNAKNQRIQEYNKARKMSYVNELGGSQNPYAKVVAKSNNSMPFKVDDIAGEPREGGAKTYEVGSQQWKTGFLGRIAEKDPAKIEGMELKYSENTKLIKGKNLVTLTLHNKAGQQVGILLADVYNDGTAKIVDTGVPEQFGNRGYSKLMLSEFGERVRSQGVKEVFGEIVDEMGRPDKARKSVFGNSELDLESYSNISTSGYKTKSKLNPDAHYKVEDDGPVPDIDWDALLKAEEKSKDKRSKKLAAQRQYTESEMSSSFVGRIAEERPILTKGKKISYKGYGQSLKMLVLEDSATGETIGSIQVQTRKSGQSGYISYSDVREAHQGRGYGTLLYSELAERLRHDGYTTLNGEIVDSLGRPFKIREKVIDQENKRIGEEGSAVWGDKVYSPLYPEAHYKVSDEQMGSAFIGRVAKENPKITKGIRVEFEKTRSSKFGDEYLLRLFKKDKADGGEEILIGSFNSEVDGNSASSGNAEIKGDFRNKGYGRLMYSEMAERLRALGAESWGGRMVDQARRPQTLRERVIDQENARLGYKDSETRLSDERQDYNGDKTFYIESTLRKEAHYKVSDSEGTPNLKPFEGNFKVSDAVKTSVVKLDEIIGRLTKTDNISPSLRDAMKALKDAVRKQDATDEVLIPELREAYDAMVRSIDDQMAGASLTPIDSLKEIHKALKPLDKKIQKNSERIQKNARDAQEADMAEGADVEGQGIQERQAAGRRDMEEGASLESDQATAEIDRRRGDARLDVEEGASLDADEATARIQETVQDTNDGADIEAGQTQANRQNLPSQFPNPAPPVPEGLPRPTPNNKPAFPRPPATPALPQVKPSGAVPFPRPPAAPAVPRGSIAPPPPQGTPAPNPLAPSLTAAKPLPKLSAWRGWTLEKGLNGGFWKNAVGWMIVVQADKFKVYNPQKAMQGIYEDLEAAKRRVQRAEPKQ